MTVDETGTTQEHTNRLIHSTSPYLLQHAHNPVDWYPWGEDALERARREDKLIFLSIGYSACHWCHVMEHESFEDERIAELMNENFVNIKVDREERPDLDEIYMAATVAMNRGQGGWPMSVFLTPDLEPVFAGTYFPPQDAHGRPGFETVLRRLAEAWERDRDNLKERASDFVRQLRRHRGLDSPPTAVGLEELRSALDRYASEFDARHGGFGSAPKFPQAVGLRLLLRLWRRFGDPHALEMTRTTLDGMARGGMYDHIGGGFARYSTDARWLVPHFEKMLYDNALLARSYLEGWQATGDGSYARVARETLDYVLRDMTAREGGFYSAQDADSEGVEGKFYVWTPEQVRDALGDAELARRFCAYYDITEAGNWEGVSIPNTPRSLADIAEELGAEPDELRESLAEARTRIFEAREQRVKPGLDDKVLTAWNGLMIGALAEGYRVLREPRYLEAAERAAEFILSELARDDGGLLRTYREGKAHLNAYLEDYAYLGEGLLDLYEAGGAVRWLGEAERLLDRALDTFLDEESGAFYHTGEEHEHLILRYQDGADGATPAPNATAASALARLSYHLDRSELRAAAARAIRAYGQLIRRYPRGFARSLCVVDFLLEGPVELAIVGPPGAQDREALEREIGRHYLPNRIQAALDPAAPDEAEALPLLAGKTPVDGASALYVCRDFTCQRPVTDPEEVAEQLPDSPQQGDTSIAERLAGQATPEGTGRYADRFQEHEHRPLGRSGLLTSALGFGGYRVSDGSEMHQRALARALAAGVNLIDTSTNYADGGSERLVGRVLRERGEAGELARDEIIVISKIGYVQGRNYELARRREERDRAYPEMVKYDEGLWHCIHPQFLQDQLRSSLDRLGLDTLDICLLHNPEYYLSDAARRGEDVESARDEFYRRVRAAFEWFEEQVDAGRLTGYGVSSNTVVAAADDADATSLSRFLEAARAAGGDDHHFQVLQLPLNLFEGGAVFEQKEGEGGQRTVLEQATESGLAVLANRPLNAFVDGAMLRLARAPRKKARVDLNEQLERVAELEESFRERIATELETAPGSLDPSRFFQLADRLRQLAPVLQGLVHWSQVESQIGYTVGSIARALDQGLEGETAARWRDWRERYFEQLDVLLQELRRRAAERTNERASEIAAAIDPELPDERRPESLSRKALWVVASTPGVTSVLNGMRQVDYVEDATGILGWPPLEDAESVYLAARTARRT